MGTMEPWLEDHPRTGPRIRGENTIVMVNPPTGVVGLPNGRNPWRK